MNTDDSRARRRSVLLKPVESKTQVDGTATLAVVNSAGATSSQDDFMASQQDRIGESFRAQLARKSNATTDQVLI